MNAYFNLVWEKFLKISDLKFYSFQPNFRVYIEILQGEPADWSYVSWPTEAENHLSWRPTQLFWNFTFMPNKSMHTAQIKRAEFLQDLLFDAQFEGGQNGWLIY